MVIDKIGNIENYLSLGENIKKALEYLKETDFSSFEDGKRELDGDNLFAVVRSYETKQEAECLLETHEKYIDIQYLFEGEEKMGYAYVGGLKVSQEYSEENDVAYYEHDCDMLSFQKGDFYILWPQDAHMPEVMAEKPINVRKVVMKVKIG